MESYSIRDNIEEVFNTYINTLQELGEEIPDWVSSVRFFYDENLSNAVAYVDADNNSITFGDHATLHAIFHELEHIRSRHRKTSVGLDDDYNKVEYYNVGFTDNGFTGVFLEEGFNELFARKLSIRACQGDFEKLSALYKEFETNKYYNFEMYVCFSICSLLNIKISDMHQMKFTGDATCQKFLNQKFEELTQIPNAWKDLQAELDLYEYAKKSIKDTKFAEVYKKEHLAKYAMYSYNLLFRALQNKTISPDECLKRLRRFDYYIKRSSTYSQMDMQNDLINAKQESVNQNKKLLKRNHILTYVEKVREKVKKDDSFIFTGDLVDYIPAKSVNLPWVLLSLIERDKSLDKSLQKIEPLIEESAYGL